MTTTAETRTEAEAMTQGHQLMKVSRSGFETVADPPVGIAGSSGVVIERRGEALWTSVILDILIAKTSQNYFIYGYLSSYDTNSLITDLCDNQVSHFNPIYTSLPNQCVRGCVSRKIKHGYNVLSVYNVKSSEYRAFIGSPSLTLSTSLFTYFEYRK